MSSGRLFKVAILSDGSPVDIRREILKGAVVLVSEYDGSCPCLISSSEPNLEEIASLLEIKNPQPLSDSEWFYLDVPFHMDEVDERMSKKPNNFQTYNPEVGGNFL